MRTKVLLLLVPMLLLAVGGAWAYSKGTGLANSPHDFVADPDNTEAIGLCLFCHTPHRANETRLLWNHKASAATYTWQDTDRTIGGTLLPTINQSWSGPTKYCLSCHDGSVAIGDVAWWDEGGPKSLNPTKHGWPSAFNVGARDGTLGNMSGNHPVALPYPFNKLKNTYNGKTTGDGVPLGEFVGDPTLNNIRLFNNPSGSLVVAGAVASITGIECSSCHDPHNGATAIGDFLLRGLPTGNTADYICLKCHVK